jgi:hypothetical protein
MLIVDDYRFESNNKRVGNIGAYDMIIFDANILLLGINNIMRAFNRNIQFTIGPYPLREGRIRTLYNFSIVALPFITSKHIPSMNQSFNLTINYETSLVEIKGKDVKTFFCLPYSTENTTVII